MIINFNQLPDIRQQHPRHGETIVFAGGCFDLVHASHVRGMEHCHAQGDILVVGISSDERVRQRKGPGRPICPQDERLYMVSSWRCVDYTFLMPMPGEDTPTIQAIKALQPDIFMDHEENRPRWQGSVDTIASLGTLMMFNDTPRTDSTTAIIKRIRQEPPHSF